MFETTLSMLDRYYWACARENAPGFDAQVVQEIRGRLHQLEHLYGNILTLQGEIMKAEEAKRGPRPADTNWIVVFTYFGPPPEPSADVPGMQPLAVHERLLLAAESFYYLAHRIKTIMEQCRVNLPRLSAFNAPGVARARNNLLEHANKKGGTSVFSFSVSNAAGLRLRPVARADEPVAYVDEGVVSNATEFRVALDKALESAAQQ